MNKSILYDIVYAYFNNTEVSYDSSMSSDLVSLMQQQSLAPFLYPVLKDNGFKKYYLGAILVNDRFNVLEDEINTLLNKNEIDHLFLKGSIIKAYYPEPFMRTRGDIDFLVNKTDYKKAQKILAENGYVIFEHNDYHSSYKKNNLEIELHFSVCKPDSVEKKYFEDVLKRSTKVYGYLYMMNASDLFIHSVCHLAKHMVLGGAGVRPIIDMYLLLENKKIDIELVKNELFKMGYKDFLDSILTLINDVFKKEYTEYEKKNIIEFKDFLLNSGIHGAMNDKYAVERSRNKDGKIKFLLKRLFLPFSSMKEYYPVLKYLPFLLPFMYIDRFFKLLKKKWKIKKVNTGDTSNTINQMYNDIGL